MSRKKYFSETEAYDVGYYRGWEEATEFYNKYLKKYNKYFRSFSKGILEGVKKGLWEEKDA